MSHQLINQDSGNTEYYTPQPIIEAARATMGRIDLDPFSSAKANERVMAALYFTASEDGLKQEWNGKVWMNHPFSREMNHKCIAKIESEFSAGHIEACCITFAATSEQWFQPLLRQPQCFLSPRTNYYLPDGALKRGVTKGSVVTYFGSNVSTFAKQFGKLGVIKVPWMW